jgi:hypothetical protein
MVSDRVGVKLALRFRTSGAGFATLLPMGEKCAGEEVLAGFRWHHGPLIEHGQIIVRNASKSSLDSPPHGTHRDTNSNRLLDGRPFAQL